jgi:hypothetical protein
MISSYIHFLIAYEDEIESLTEMSDRFERQAERIYQLRREKSKLPIEGKCIHEPPHFYLENLIDKSRSSPFFRTVCIW